MAFVLNAERFYMGLAIRILLYLINAVDRPLTETENQFSVETGNLRQKLSHLFYCAGHPLFSLVKPQRYLHTTQTQTRFP